MKRVVLAATFGLVALGGLALQAQNQRSQTLHDFMRRKLVHSQKTPEGIVTKDFDMIAKNAQAMSLLSLDASWQVIQTPEYFERSTEFRRTANTLDQRAREKNLDATALSYVQLTMQCFECHKYVREFQEEPSAPKKTKGN